MDSPMLTPKDVAARLSISVREVQKLCKKGTLPSYRIGKRRLRISPADLENYLAGCRVQEEPARARLPEPKMKGATNRGFRFLKGAALPTVRRT